jgi:hypothetical protein
MFILQGGIVARLLRREVGLCKLRYSKTLRADWAGALFGAICGLFVGYLGLASVGAVSVDLSDLTSLTLAVVALTVSALASHRVMRSYLSLYRLSAVLLLPFSALVRLLRLL